MLVVIAKLIGAALFTAFYEWAMMQRLWGSLSANEYRSSLKRGRWLTILAVYFCVAIVLEIAPARQDDDRIAGICLIAMIGAILVHGIFAFRDIELPPNGRGRKP